MVVIREILQWRMRQRFKLLRVEFNFYDFYKLFMTHIIITWMFSVANAKWIDAKSE